MSMYNKVSWNLLGQLVHASYVFCTVPLILNYYDAATYGVFVFLNHLIALTALFDLGRSLKTYVDQSSGDVALSEITNQFTQYLGIGLWVSIFAIIYGLFGQIAGNITYGYDILAVIVIVVAANWPRSIYRSILLGASKEKSFNIVYAISDITRIISIVCMSLVFPAGPLSLMLSLATISVVEISVYHLLSNRLNWYPFQPDWHIVNLNPLRNKYYIYAATSILILQIPFFWTGFVYGEVGLSYLGLLMLPVSAITTLFYPVTTSLMNIFAKHDGVYSSVMYLKEKATVLVSAIIIIVIAAMSSYHIWYHVIIDDGVRVPTLFEYTVMVAAGLFLLIANIVATILIGHNQVRTLSFAYGIATIGMVLFLVIFASASTAIFFSSLVLVGILLARLGRSISLAT